MIGEINSINLNNAIRSFDKLGDGGGFVGTPARVQPSSCFVTANGTAVKKILLTTSKKMDGNIGKRILRLSSCSERHKGV